MKALLPFLLLPLLFTFAQAQEAVYLDKVQTLDHTIETLYGVISGEAGVERGMRCSGGAGTERLSPAAEFCASIWARRSPTSGVDRAG